MQEGPLKTLEGILYYNLHGRGSDLPENSQLTAEYIEREIKMIRNKLDNIIRDINNLEKKCSKLDLM